MKQYEVPLVWMDGQDRWMSLCNRYAGPAMKCRFPDGGWCIWCKVVDKIWLLRDGSNLDREDGGRATKPFAKKLDKAYEELITHKAIETIVLND